MEAAAKVRFTVASVKESAMHGGAPTQRVTAGHTTGGQSERDDRDWWLDRGSDVTQDLADLATKEDECDDRNDGDKDKDQCVFDETLTILTNESGKELAGGEHLQLSFALGS